MDGLGLYRADELAGAASDTCFGLYPGMVDIVFLHSINCMGGAHFRAGAAIPFVGVDQAFLFFKNHISYPGSLFFSKGKGKNGARSTDKGAGVAGIGTAAQVKIKAGLENAGHAKAFYSRQNNLFRADSYTGKTGRAG